MAPVLNAGKHSLGDLACLAVRQGRWPDDWACVLPVPLHHPERLVHGNRCQFGWQVPRVAAPGQPHHGQCPSGAQEQAHPSQGRGGIHVVKRSDRNDGVERARLKVIGEEVAAEILDAFSASTLAGTVEDRPIAVDRHHMWKGLL